MTLAPQCWGGVPIEATVIHSPLAYPGLGVKTKLRKKVTTFANPPVDLVNMLRDNISTSVLYYKHIMIVNDDSRVVCK